MIAVDFQCPECGLIFEEIVDSCVQFTGCPECEIDAKRIYSFNTGHRADPTWLPSALDLLQPDGEKRIESRSELDKYLKKHNIVQRC